MDVYYHKNLYILRAYDWLTSFIITNLQYNVWYAKYNNARVTNVRAVFNVDLLIHVP